MASSPHRVRLHIDSTCDLNLSFSFSYLSLLKCNIVRMMKPHKTCLFFVFPSIEGDCRNRKFRIGSYVRTRWGELPTGRNRCNFMLYQGSETLEHPPTVWPVLYACSQTYYPGSGSHGQLLRPCL